MNTSADTSPVVLAFAPLDPSGRNGLHAMIETVACLGGHCAAIPTALCASGSAYCELVPVSSGVVVQQARSILEDMPVSVVVVGYVATIENLEAIHSILEDYPDIPIVCASTLQHWEEGATQADQYPRALLDLITPKSHLLIAAQENTDFLTRNGAVSEDRIHRLFTAECKYLLTYECKAHLKAFSCNLYDEENILSSASWQTNQNALGMQHMEDTLAAAAATYLGHGMSITSVVKDALTWSEQAANHARRIGLEAASANHFFWVK